MHVDKRSGQGKNHLEGTEGVKPWCQGQKQRLLLIARLENTYNSSVYPFPEADVTDKQ